MKLGDYSKLRVVKRVEFGVYLDGGKAGEVLLPARYVPEGTAVGDELEVFIYLDQEERITATTEHPIAKVGEFATLEVKWVNQYGAFLDWGLMKDLFCPFAEQKKRMKVGERHFVYILIDEQTYRIMASAKVERWLKKGASVMQTGDFVHSLIDYMREHNGHCELGDKSDAQEVYATFGVSKKVFKRALGELYKERKIMPDGEGWILVV